MKPREMVPGALYRIQYKSQSGNYRWYLYEMTAVFLGRAEDIGEFQFSMRPLAGTVALSSHNEIVLVEEVISREDIQAKYHYGIRDPLLPVRRSRRIGPINRPKEGMQKW